MNTVRDRLEEDLIEHGLWPSEATNVFDLMLDRSVSGDGLSEVKWNDPAGTYPTQLHLVILTILKKTAVEWIDQNKPKHFARAILA